MAKTTTTDLNLRQVPSSLKKALKLAAAENDMTLRSYCIVALTTAVMKTTVTVLKARKAKGKVAC